MRAWAGLLVDRRRRLRACPLPPWKDGRRPAARPGSRREIRRAACTRMQGGGHQASPPTSETNITGPGVGFRQAEMLTASVLSPDDGGGWAAQGRTKREQALKQACICWAGRKVSSTRLGLTTTNSHNSLITFQSTSTSSRQQGDDVLAASVDSWRSRRPGEE